MEVAVMEKLADPVSPGYGLYERSGFPHNTPSPQVDAPLQITHDVVMEALLELFVYNLLKPPFPEPLRVRLAVHAGPCQYFERHADFRSDTLRRQSLYRFRMAWE
jgi:hypothetical protein